MTAMRAHPLFACVLLLAFSSAAFPAQDPTDHDHAGSRAGRETPPPPKDAAEFAKRLEADGITFDRARREVHVRGDLIRRQRSREYPVEYGIVIEGGFTHEAFGIVTCTPSLLNACFLAMGLQPGMARRRQLRDPLPSREDVDAGLIEPWEVLAPSGDRVFLYVRWNEPDGTAVTRAFEDFFVDLRTTRPLPLRGYVYLGSRFDEVLLGTEKKSVFLADYEGNILTLHPDKSRADNCLFDVYAQDDEPYTWADVDEEKLPPAGVALDFVFTLLPLPGTRPFEPELPRAPIVLRSVAELVAESLNPCADGSGADWVAKLGTRELFELAGIMKRSRHAPLRERCAVALGATRRDEAIESLQLMLRFDRAGEVRLAAAYGLGEIGSDAALAALIEVVAHGAELAREDALTALRFISGEDFGLKPLAWQSWLAAR